MMVLKKQSKQWIIFLQEKYTDLCDCKPITFRDIVPSQIPEVAGVYLITARKSTKEIPYYIGRTKNLRQRIYNNHLMGPFTNARLKKYLVNYRECKDINKAKIFIKNNCLVRWIEEPSIRNRNAIEGYATGLLSPKYGMYEEH
jgi:predicted GIY-YIG superfamily endonuclease